MSGRKKTKYEEKRELPRKTRLRLAEAIKASKKNATMSNSMQSSTYPAVLTWIVTEVFPYIN